MKESYWLYESKDNGHYVVSPATVNGVDGLFAFTGLVEEGKFIITGIQNVDEDNQTVGKAASSPFIGTLIGSGRITDGGNKGKSSVEFSRSLNGELKIPSFKANPPPKPKLNLGNRFGEMPETMLIPDVALLEDGRQRTINRQHVHEITMPVASKNGKSAIHLVGNIPDESDPITRRQLDNFVIKAIDVLDKDGHITKTIELNPNRPIKIPVNIVTSKDGNDSWVIEPKKSQKQIESLLNDSSVISNAINGAIETAPQKSLLDIDRASLGKFSSPVNISAIVASQSSGRAT